MARKPIGLSIDPQVADLLERVDNKSAYIQRIIEERWREWQAAHMYATAHGWTGADLLAACAALNGHLPQSYDGAGAEDIALALGDARVYGSAATEIDEAHWSRLVGSVRLDDDLWRAIWTISREWWAGNRQLATILERDR